MSSPQKIDCGLQDTAAALALARHFASSHGGLLPFEQRLCSEIVTCLDRDTPLRDLARKLAAGGGEHFSPQGVESAPSTGAACKAIHALLCIDDTFHALEQMAQAVAPLQDAIEDAAALAKAEPNLSPELRQLVAVKLPAMSQLVDEWAAAHAESMDKADGADCGLVSEGGAA